MKLEYSFPNGNAVKFIPQDFILESGNEVYLLVFDEYHEIITLLGVVEGDDEDFYYYNVAQLSDLAYRQMIDADEFEEFEIEDEIFIKKNGIPPKLDYYLSDCSPMLIQRGAVTDEGIFFFAYAGNGLYNKRFLKKAI